MKGKAINNTFWIRILEKLVDSWSRSRLRRIFWYICLTGIWSGLSFCSRGDLVQGRGRGRRSHRPGRRVSGRRRPVHSGQVGGRVSGHVAGSGTGIASTSLIVVVRTGTCAGWRTYFKIVAQVSTKCKYTDLNNFCSYSISGMWHLWQWHHQTNRIGHVFPLTWFSGKWEHWI